MLLHQRPDRIGGGERLSDQQESARRCVEPMRGLSIRAKLALRQAHYGALISQRGSLRVLTFRLIDDGEVFILKDNPQLRLESARLALPPRDRDPIAGVHRARRDSAP